MRITIDIDDNTLKELKKLQRRERNSLGKLVSYLLALSLANSRTQSSSSPTFEWIAKSMGARVDLADKDAVLGDRDGHAQ